MKKTVLVVSAIGLMLNLSAEQYYEGSDYQKYNVQSANKDSFQSGNFNDPAPRPSYQPGSYTNPMPTHRNYYQRNYYPQSGSNLYYQNSPGAYQYQPESPTDQIMRNYQQTYSSQPNQSRDFQETYSSRSNQPRDNNNYSDQPYQ